MRKYLFLIFSVFALSVCVPQISVNELYIPKEEVDERIGLYMYYPYFTRELAFLNDVITKRFGTACEHKNELISNRYSYALLNIASDSVPKRKGGMIKLHPCNFIMGRFCRWQNCDFVPPARPLTRSF
ncbi:MAG: hypothetical protein IJP90_13965 [Treponema sp.]|nr:hypothetical protein [Treponema sp.]